MGHGASIQLKPPLYKREDLAGYARVCSFFNVVLRNNINIDTIGLFLLDPLARVSFKSFLKKSLSSERADCYIDSLSREFLDHTLCRVTPSVTTQCFLLYLKSRHFSSLYAGMRASITKLACECEEFESSPLGESSIGFSRDRNSTSKDFSTPRCSPGSLLDDSIVETQLNLDDSSFDAAGNNLLVAEDYSRSVFLSFDSKDFASIVRSQSWLASLILAAESMSLPIVLMNTGSVHRGAQIIYVNPAFHLLTGFSKAEMLGLHIDCLYEAPVEQTEKYGGSIDQMLKQNCIVDTTHLHAVSCSKAEAGERYVLNQAVRCGHEVSVELPAYKKNGKPFRRQLMTKPIYDQHEHYRYLLGAYFNLEIEVSPEQLAFVENGGDVRIQLRAAHNALMAILPKQIIID